MARAAGGGGAWLAPGPPNYHPPSTAGLQASWRPSAPYPPLSPRGRLPGPGEELCSQSSHRGIGAERSLGSPRAFEKGGGAIKNSPQTLENLLPKPASAQESAARRMRSPPRSKWRRNSSPTVGSSPQQGRGPALPEPRRRGEGGGWGSTRKLLRDTCLPAQPPLPHLGSEAAFPDVGGPQSPLWRGGGAAGELPVPPGAQTA